MRLLQIMLLTAVLTTPALTVPGGSFEFGFQGMTWGEILSPRFELTEISVQGDIGYYAKNDENFTIGGVHPENVLYGFYRNAFFAVFLEIGSRDDFNEIKAYISSLYGGGRAQLRVSQTIYIWEDHDVKLKLKHYDNAGRYKMGIYYSPLSSDVNRLRMEAGFEKTLPLVHRHSD